MTRILRLAAAALIAGAAAPSFAQDNRLRDSGGAVMDLSKWQDIPAHEFMLNIVDLPSAEPGRAQRRVRNKGTPHERIRFDRREGFIYVEHLYVTLYNENVTDLFQSVAFTRKLAERHWKRRVPVERFTIEEERKIHSSYERGGWVLATRGKNSGVLCIIARLAFLSEGAGSGSFTHEAYNTGVSYRDYSGKRSFDDVVTWLKGVKLVEPPYNRVR